MGKKFVEFLHEVHEEIHFVHKPDFAKEDNIDMLRKDHIPFSNHVIAAVVQIIQEDTSLLEIDDKAKKQFEELETAEHAKRLEILKTLIDHMNQTLGRVETCLTSKMT